MHSSGEPRIVLVLSKQGSFPLLPRRLWVLPPPALCVHFGRNPGICSQKPKQLIVYLDRDFILLEAISHTFLHFDLHDNSEKGIVGILTSSLQMENFGSEWLHRNDGAGEGTGPGDFPHHFATFESH